MNSNKRNDKLHGKIGPGGIGCPCCTPYESVKKNRTWLNRIRRRLVKILIRKELKNVE